MFIFERERDVGEGQRGGHMIWSRLCAESREPDVGLQFMSCEIMT